MASPSPWILDVEERDFEREVIERSREVPVVVDFWAPWCGPCRTLGPLLERLAEEAKGAFVLAKVDVDRAPNLALEFAVQAIPAVKAFRGGALVDEFSGVLPEAHIREFLKGLAPSEADTLVASARDLETGDAPGAEAAYRRALELDPRHDPAKLGLVRCLIARGEDAEAASLIENVVPSDDLAAERERLGALLEIRALRDEAGDPEELRSRSEADPEDAELRYRLGVALAVTGRYEEALAALLEAAARDRALARDRVRELMVQIFHVVGAKSPLASDSRKRLARLIY